MSLAEFEGEAATALKKLNEGAPFEAEIIERMMDLSLENKERWESQIQKMKESGREVNDDITYEDIKAFHESKAYTIEIAREHHIHMEFVKFEAILPYLEGRKWLVLKSTGDSGPFITTDNPVNLTWNNPDSIPPFYRSSPGFGLRETQVYFPVSKEVALIGEFDGKEGLIYASKALVATLNSKMLHFFYKQVYAPKYGFNFYSKEGEILSGKQLLKQLGA